ncbi:MAG: FHA domain-containing protein [Proteobacteria bacterium]|nr:FHA domain-containing protein [Pseudomonadota bacterium]
MATNENEWQGALSAIDLSAIESLKTLKQEHDQLSERLKSMAAMKSNFADAVYVRVRADYEKRIAALDTEAAPLKQAAREQYARLRALLARFEADHEAVKLDQQELELRHQLGEFDDKEFGKRMKAIETTVAERGQARARGLELKARFLEAFHSESELEQADAGGTNRFSMADLAEAQARTQEVASVVGGDAPPNKTQTMSAINIPEPARPPAAAPAPAAAGGATQIFRAARLVPQNPEAGKQTYTLTLKPIDIGADAGNDVRIGGPGVDPKHAKIVVSMGGFTIVDLGSKHGTRVNAEKVRERPLANEDVIQIGAARFVFREG